MKSKKGITLVALIITIIVMLILAGVAISTAIGDNGVITQTQAAIKEQERADVQDIIIGSYVFKVTGSFNSFAYIDIDKTGIAIYDNLKANGFEVKDPITVDDGNGNDVLSAPIEKDANDNSIGIEVTVQGNHGEYFGKLESRGLVGDIVPVPEEDEEQEPPIVQDPPVEPSTPAVEKYSFTLNELIGLGPYTKDIIDSGFYFDLSNVWEAVGADLSQNSDYYYQVPGSETIVYMLQSDDDRFIGYNSIVAGIFSVGENTKFKIDGTVSGDSYWFYIKTVDNKEVVEEFPEEGQMTHDEFIDLYGDVEFSFIKISDYIQ